MRGSETCDTWGVFFLWEFGIDGESFVLCRTALHLLWMFLRYFAPASQSERTAARSLGKRARSDLKLPSKCGQIGQARARVCPKMDDQEFVAVLEGRQRWLFVYQKLKTERFCCRLAIFRDFSTPCLGWITGSIVNLVRLYLVISINQIKTKKTENTDFHFVFFFWKKWGGRADNFVAEVSFTLLLLLLSSTLFFPSFFFLFFISISFLPCFTVIYLSFSLSLLSFCFVFLHHL